MAGPQPIPSYRDPNTLADVTAVLHDFGVVDADTASAEYRMLVFNNFGGTVAVPDMTDCKFTTKDSSSGNTSDPVIGKWVQLKCLSTSETAFTPVGGSEGVELGATGSGVFGHEHPIAAKGQAPGVIKGSINTGAITDTANFADISVKAAVPLNAYSGATTFRFRVNFKYT